MLFEKVNKALAQAKVVATSLVTFVVGLSLLVQNFSADIASELPFDVEPWTVTVTSALAAAVFALRRLTEVNQDKQGILPQEPTKK